MLTFLMNHLDITILLTLLVAATLVVLAIIFSTIWRRRPRQPQYRIVCWRCGTHNVLVGRSAGRCSLCHVRVAVVPETGAVVGGYQPQDGDSGAANPPSKP